jgi:membrane protein DedA with SNARE-associated domain
LNHQSFGWLWDQVLVWVHQYGYHAVIPVLVADPAGVPWAWIFLLMLAPEAHLNSGWLLAYGFLVLTVNDHLLYWAGALGGRPLVARLGQRWPKLERAMLSAEDAMNGRGIWAVVVGRYLPLIGRWIGVGAGLAKVSFWRFALYDAMGVALTVIGFGAAANFIGHQLAHHAWFPQAVAATFALSTLVTLLLIVWQVRQAQQARSK